VTIQFLAAVIVVITYAGVAIGRMPYLRMNRTTIALVGAAALMAVGAITQQQAFAAIDLGTIMLLFAMMVINTNLRMAGFFRLVGNRVLQLANTPYSLLGLVVVASGVLSALFMNDPICLLFTPLVIEVTQHLGRNPIPYLIGLATAANIGSTATITGNPQNLIIGQSSGISYITFLLHLAPIALIGLFICWCVIVAIYREEFARPLTRVQMSDPRPYWPLLNRSTIVVFGMLIAFLVGVPIASATFVAAGLLLISRIRVGKLLDVDWGLLAFFSGLFIVTGAIETTGLSTMLFKGLSPILHGGVTSLSIVTVLLSNVVSNVPAVLLLRPEMQTFVNPQQAWLTLAMASTLAGNLTLLGSVANLIVAEVAAEQNVKLGFMEYLRAGLPITILTLTVGIFWLNTFG
jgi:Na+/H+ antiporter NhaD/arsenite permease-like protein